MCDNGHVSDVLLKAHDVSDLLDCEFDHLIKKSLDFWGFPGFNIYKRNLILLLIVPRGQIRTFSVKF